MDGYLASSLIDWEIYLSKLIEDLELRIKIAENAQLKIKMNWLLSQNTDKHLNIYMSTISKNSDINNFPFFYHIEKSITRQNYDFQLKKDKLINQLEETENFNKELKDYNKLLLNQIIINEQEILNYALSKSWKLTRPFRKLLQKFNLRS